MFVNSNNSPQQGMSDKNLLTRHLIEFSFLFSGSTYTHSTIYWFLLSRNNGTRAAWFRNHARFWQNPQSIIDFSCRCGEHKKGIVHKLIILYWCFPFTFLFCRLWGNVGDWKRLKSVIVGMCVRRVGSWWWWRNMAREKELFAACLSGWRRLKASLMAY